MHQAKNFMFMLTDTQDNDMLQYIDSQLIPPNIIDMLDQIPVLFHPSSITLYINIDSCALHYSRITRMPY